MSELARFKLLMELHDLGREVMNVSWKFDQFNKKHPIDSMDARDQEIYIETYLEVLGRLESIWNKYSEANDKLNKLNNKSDENKNNLD